METQDESIDISSIKRALLNPGLPAAQHISQSDAAISGNKQLSAIRRVFEQAVAGKSEGVRNGHSSQTNSQRPGQQVTQGFSHLASTVPDSQDVQPIIDVASFLKPIALPPNPPPSNKVLPEKMTSQSSPNDTQELSPTYYTRLINSIKNKGALELAQAGQSQDADDAVTQRTNHTGDLGHIDLGLGDSDREDDEAQASDRELDSEPIEFSPTQATQNRLSQFPESQRFKTPATNGKKRNFLGDVIESPALPRNPFATDGGTKTPLHTLGLSQVFAGTQAGSSPIITRHISEPASDRPSPNIEVQTRPATISLSSPLRPCSELKRIASEPQSRYVSIKQSQAERERLVALRQQSPDGSTSGDQSDDNFDVEESSILERARLRREIDEKVRERFARFSSPTRPGSAGKAGEQAARQARAQTSSPILWHKKRVDSSRMIGKETAVMQGPTAGDSEEETDVEESEQVVIEHSSQLPHENEDENKENVQTNALQIPETVVRLNQAINGCQDGQDVSPTLRRSFAHPAVEQLRSSQTIRQAITHTDGISVSPTVAVANSQPDQPWSRKLLSELGDPLKGLPGNSFVSSSAAAAGQIESSPRRDCAEDHNDLSQVAQEDANGQTHHEEVNQCGEHGLTDEEKSARTLPDGHTMANSRTGSKQRAELPSTVPETMSARGSTRSGAQGSSDTATSVNGSRAEQLSSKYETARSHLSSSTPVSRPLNSLFSSPSGRKRKRLGDIAAQPSPKKMSGEADVEEVMAAMDDADFYNAVEGAPGSSSPIPPGRNPKRRCVMGKQQTSSRATTVSADTTLPSSPPTVDLHKTSHNSKLSPSVPSVRSHPRPAKRSEAIWDVQTSPPKSAAATSLRNTARESRGLARNNSRSVKYHESTVAETVHDDSNQETHVTQPPTTLTESATSNQQPNSPTAEVVAPNQVLASFNGKPRGYYPATCIGSTGLKSEGTFRYQIQWDDSSRDDIDEGGVRRLDFRVGDQVKVISQGWPRVVYTIQGFKDRVDKIDGEVTDIRGYRTLLVKPKKRKSLPAEISTESTKEAPLSAVYLDTNMWRQMRGRTFNIDATNGKPRLTVHVPPHDPSHSGLATPSEGPSTPSTPTSRTRRRSEFPLQRGNSSVSFPDPPAATGIFSNMAFAISYDNLSRKESLTKAILVNGGALLGEDFHEMFDSQVTPTSPSVRMHETGTLALNARFLNKGFVALIADRHSRKPKYMQALALGIPSLSGRWIEACVAANTILDWQPYLLSAGESLELEGAVRSRVLPQVDANTATLKDMISKRPKLLKEEAAIVVKGRGKAEEKRKPYIFLTKAAGAGRLETCVDIKSAKALLDEDAENSIRWVCVDDKELGKAETALLPKGKEQRSKELRIVGNEFICQSLILGRLWDSS
ncbi:hypothetical protein GJ744_010256 [Endocarpon pusillum]|uniref:BRCT domain-containing protein n=1 Tax=Endocarpon pusillum TaxID=364733 RepID=A0A8H7AI78_9EURO|nr:hypothetical protein GJ744_010256 [Endocarpon pusillum]